MARARTFKIFGRDIVIGKRLFGLGAEDSFGISGLSGAVGTNAVDDLETYKGIVFACINLIAETVAQYEPIIYKKDGDQWKDIGADHPLLQLLRRPSGRADKAVNITMYDLLYATASFIELQSDVYWYIGKGRQTGMPREITIIRKDRVGMDINKKTGEIDRYYIRQKGGGKVYIPVEDMLPFVGFDPLDPYSGKSTVEASRAYIATDNLTNQFTENFFRNNAGVSGVLSIQGEVTKDGFKKMVRAFRSKYEGVDNAGKIMMIRGDEAKLTKFGLGLDELDMPVLRKMSRDDIAMMFRVPMPLLGKAEETGLGRANVEALEYTFAKYNIEPKLKKFDSILQVALERYYNGQGLKVGHKNIIPEDKEYNLNKTDKYLDRIYTRNEARSREGLDDIEGGDELFVPMSQLPLNVAGGYHEDAPASKGIVIKRTRRVLSIVKDLEYTTEKKESFRVRIMRNQTAYERKFKKVFKPILTEQKKEALKNLEAHASSATKAFDQKLFDDANADKVMKKAITPVMSDLAKEQGALALLFAGDEDTEFKLTATLAKIIEQRLQKMASNFNDETISALNKTLAEGIQAGENLDKLKGRVEDVYSGAEGYRAERLARTETLNASNEATNQAYRQTGYVTGKQWYANPDADAECEAMDGKEIGLDETFLKQGESFTYKDGNGDEQVHTNTYDDVDSPPLHPNCRCTIIPTREEA